MAIEDRPDRWEERGQDGSAAPEVAGDRPSTRPSRRSSGRRSQGASTRRRAVNIWTPANILTTVRALLIPVWIAAAEAVTPSDGSNFSIMSFLVALFYIALAGTDKLDGYLARSRNEITVYGQFLDPIADKLVVLIALLYLFEKGLVNVWVLVIVITREFVVSGLRMVVAAKGVVIAASDLGKYKTASTMVSICGLLLWLAFPAGVFADALRWISSVLMGVAMVLTAWSGIDYLWKSKDYLFMED